MSEKKYQLIDKAVWIEDEKEKNNGVLVFGDIHLGFEEMLNKQGVFVPREQYKKIINNLDKIFSFLRLRGKKIKEIVILGDIKHEFGEINQQEWKEVLDFLDYLNEKIGEKGEIILIKGNHDNILPWIVKEKVKVKDFYIKEENLFIHGDKEVKEFEDKKIKRMFLGHMHPAISIKKDIKKEIYKCFLVGKYKGKEIVILPSFFPLIEGSDVSFYDTNLVYDFNLKKFEVFIPVNINKILDFGVVEDVGRLV